MAKRVKRNDPYRSWGGYPPARHTQVLSATWRDDPIPPSALTDSSCLCFGNGRSYGDACLNDGGALIDARGLDHFISFNPEDGVLECEAGLLLSDIIRVVLPKGWFLPVSPGTQFVTVGGAIANDVHGKNHHRAGSMGHHIQTLQLLRSDGSRLSCSLSENSDLFRATIGGMGLTGLITRAQAATKTSRRAVHRSGTDSLLQHPMSSWRFQRRPTRNSNTPLRGSIAPRRENNLVGES